MRLGVNYRRRSFTPTALFRSASPGITIDPSDLSTLFQSTADSLLPVTAAGQAVTLALDKSQGLALGAPVSVAAPTIVAAWTDAGGGVFTAAGVNGSLTFPGTLTVGKVYYAEITISRTSGTVYGPYDGAATQQNPKATSGVHSQYFSAVGTTLYIYSLGFTGSVSNITVREVLGNHAYQATAASRPVYGIMPATGVRNLAENSVWAGAASGAPGTAPTSWTRWTTAPVGTTTISGASATFAATAQRAFFLYAFTAATTTVYSVSVEAVVSAGSLTVAQCIGTTTSLAGATSAYMLNGAVVAGSTAIPAGTNRIALIYTTAGTGGSVTVRMGAGITDVATGTVAMRDPQLEIAAAPTAYQARASATNITEAGVRNLHYLLADGSDDGLATAAIDFSGTDKVSVFAAVRKSSDAATGMVVELSANLNSNNGSFYMLAPAVNGQASSAFVSKGTVSASAAASTFAAPVTGVLTGLGDISGDVVKHRRNGAQVAEATTDQGTGNFGNYALYIGRRGGASLPFNGLIFGLVVVGKAATAAEIARTERFLAYKAGVAI